LDAADSIFQKQPEKSKHYFLRARELAAGSLEEARQTLWHLRNEPPNSPGIVASLQQLVAKTESTAQLKFDVHGLQVPLKTEIEENVLRIAQEALNNAMKYSKAEWIRIDLSFERHAVRLKVEDNGSGFIQDPDAFSQTNHFGLKGMQERAAQLGGSLQVQSEPGKGTTVSFSIPK
jgi:signal transduction histidine kinase